MKEVTYGDWQKNPTHRMMWVWNEDEKFKVQRKVVYVLRADYVRVLTVNDNNSDYELYSHCAEIEKQRRMTNKELARWLREKPTREYKLLRSDDAIISYYHDYIERTANEEIEDSFLIREDDGDWREPLVEV